MEDRFTNLTEQLGQADQVLLQFNQKLELANREKDMALSSLKQTASG